jgi:hypothetical protein
MPGAQIAEGRAPAEWPALPLDSWRDTYATLHMWTQIVGKVCLALTPLTNHFWNTAFHLTARGFITPAMSAGGTTITFTFDFIDHELIIHAADGRIERIALEPRSVADFFRAVMEALGRLDIPVRLWKMPVEIPNPVPFDRDTEHASYDPGAANAFWRVMLAINPVFEQFRSSFLGKCSPVHFFWGSFDLAVTRFSGARAPERPGADVITREAYSHCVISHGFWPGSGTVAQAAFYAYATPEPDGFKQAAVAPSAYYDPTFSIFVLPYEAVRTAASPADDLAAFLQNTYTTAADLAGWKRSELERT